MMRLATHPDGRVDWLDQGHNSGKFKLEKQMEGYVVCFHFEVKLSDVTSVPYTKQRMGKTAFFGERH